MQKDTTAVKTHNILKTDKLLYFNSKQVSNPQISISQPTTHHKHKILTLGFSFIKQSNGIIGPKKGAEDKVFLL